MASSSGIPAQKEGPIRILHLTHLHFADDTLPHSRLQWLIDDITKGDCLCFDTIEYLVITGDITDRGREEGFEKAREFVQLLTERFGLSAQRWILVPGNHDVQDRHESYDWRADVNDLRPEQYLRQGEIYLVRNDDKYNLRLKKISEAFFHKVVQEPYPLDYSEQGIAYLFPETGIQFLALNSSWQVDQFHRKRSGIHPDAVMHAIQEADKQVQDAIAKDQLKKNCDILRIGVWHHAITGQNMMANVDFLGHMQKNGVKLCLHGDVHELRCDHIGYRHEKELHVIGAGSFGSPPESRPESTPRLYNILEIRRDLASIRVHTRFQPRTNSEWRGWYEWSSTDGYPGRFPYYDIILKR